MKLFLDSASIADTTEAFSHSLVSGITTNPALVAKEPPHPLGYLGHLRDLVRIIGPETPISVQPAISDLRASPREHIGIIKGTLQSRHLIIKIPMSWENLPLIRLASMAGVPVNVCCVTTAEQAIAALNAGARYVEMNGYNSGGAAEGSVRLVRDLIDQASGRSNQRPEIICGSVKNSGGISKAFAAGAHIVAVGLSALSEMAYSHLSAQTAEGFEKARKDWDAACAAIPLEPDSGQSPEPNTSAEGQPADV